MRTLLTVLLIASTALAQTSTDTDADGDGLLDREEDRNENGIVDTGETDPHNADSDGGGEADGAELRHDRDPLNPADDAAADPDTDGLINRDENQLGTNPGEKDSDFDGVPDATDPFPLDTDWKSDKDSDGLPDELEELFGLSGEIRSDAQLDLDNDGLTNLEEFIEGTDIDNPDTDYDGKTDGREVELGTSPLENPCLHYVGGGKFFFDLQNHWAKEWVEPLHGTKVLPSGKRIVDGYAQVEQNKTVFLPDQPITRFELLKIALLTTCSPLLEHTSGIEIAGQADRSFTDLSKRPRPNEDEDRKQRRQMIYTAVDKGIISGYSDGSVRPDDPVNRAEAMKILTLASRLEPLLEPYATHTFADVSSEHWFQPYVRRLVDYGMIEGYKQPAVMSGQTVVTAEHYLFKPEQYITRAEASKVLLLLMITNPRVNGYVIPVE